MAAVTPDQVARMLALRSEGLTHREIAGRAGLSRDCVAGHLARAEGVVAAVLTCPRCGWSCPGTASVHRPRGGGERMWCCSCRAHTYATVVAHASEARRCASCRAYLSRYTPTDVERCGPCRLAEREALRARQRAQGTRPGPGMLSVLGCLPGRGEQVARELGWPCSRVAGYLVRMHAAGMVDTDAHGAWHETTAAAA